jgi:hypothetical protein
MGQASGKALTPRKNVEVAVEAYGRMRRYAAERALPVGLPLLSSVSALQSGSPRR